MKIDILTAMSLNGIISPHRGTSSLELINKLNVPKEVLELQYNLRKEYDAIMLGTGAVLIDNPTLNSHNLEEAIRITIDPFERIPKNYHFLDGSIRTIIGVSNQTSGKYLSFLENNNIEYIIAGEKRVESPLFYDKLTKEKNISSILVEGGGNFNYNLLKENLIDNLQVIVMPVLLDSSSVNLFDSNKNIFNKMCLEDIKKIDDYLFIKYKIK